MRFWRARVVWVAALTLTVQVGVIAAASAALCCGPHHPTASMDDMACCKAANGAPHACPLKKKPAPGVPTMTSCCTPDQQALAALFAFVGVPEAPVSMMAVPAATVVEITAAPQPIALVSPPDAPPPRA